METYQEQSKVFIHCRQNIKRKEVLKNNLFLITLVDIQIKSYYIMNNRNCIGTYKFSIIRIQIGFYYSNYTKVICRIIWDQNLIMFDRI